MQPAYTPACHHSHSCTQPREIATPQTTVAKQKPPQQYYDCCTRMQRACTGVCSGCVLKHTPAPATFCWGHICPHLHRPGSRVEACWRHTTYTHKQPIRPADSLARRKRVWTQNTHKTQMETPVNPSYEHIMHNPCCRHSMQHPTPHQALSPTLSHPCRHRRGRLYGHATHATP